MLVMERLPDHEMPDFERELADSIARRTTAEGNPLDGLFNLTRRTDTDDDDQYDVDLTILDFLVYKTASSVFEWRLGFNPHHSDLPSALVTMYVQPPQTRTLRHYTLREFRKQ
jgi:hypothetical protein